MQYGVSNTGMYCIDRQHFLAETRLLANPILSKVRVYVTQSTHKALTSLRQGSMVHVHDEYFEKVSPVRYDLICD